jgi:hypothetical protein
MMNTEKTSMTLDDIANSAPNRALPLRKTATGATVLVASLALAAILPNIGDRTTRPEGPAEPVVDDQATLSDLVNRGLIPRQTLEPAPPAADDTLRDLVNRGLIPPETLDG